VINSSKIRALAAAAVVLSITQAHAAEAVEWKQSDGGNGHWYQFIPDLTVDWTTASQRAAALGGHLATITSQAENDFIFNHLNAVSGYVGHPNELRGPFVGAYQDLAAADHSEPRGGWRWVTGEAWAEGNWDDYGHGEPNNTCGCSDPEDVLTIDNRLGVCVWNDSPAAGQYRSGYLIEWDADCDGNGRADKGDIARGLKVDTNGNSVPDACEGGLPAQVFSSEVVGVEAAPRDRALRMVSVAYGVVAGIDLSGHAVAWGAPYEIVEGMPSGVVKDLSVGGGECAVAVLEDGSLRVWGTGVWSQSLVTRFTPVGNDFVAVSAAAGARHAAALRADGGLVVWGSNAFGECNIPVTSYLQGSAGGHLFWSPCTLAVTPVGAIVQAGGGAWFGGTPTGTGFRSVSCGYYHGAAIREDGTAACWGWNAHGQCNAPSGTFVQIAAGSVHTLGLRASGEVVGWGAAARASDPAAIGVRASYIAADAYSSAVVVAGDCDGNGELDSLSIMSGEVIDRDQNAAIDACQCLDNPASAVCCRSDFDLNGEVNSADLALILLNFGRVEPGMQDFDLDGNDEISSSDVSMLLADLGPCHD
jgi:hypothetical protein